jgi:hypothetical protein
METSVPSEGGIYLRKTMHRINRVHVQWNSHPAAPFPGGDSVSDILKDCARLGLLDELRATLGVGLRNDDAPIRAVRDLVYELAGEQNRDLAVDVLIHATGVAEFDHRTLRDYARKHGLSHEGFRQRVIALQHRLGLPHRPMQPSDAN